MKEKYQVGPAPKEALAYFRAKQYKTGFDYRDVWREQHATAFTVAKAMQMDILESINNELDRALAEGRTFADFKKDLTPTLQKLGWWGKQDQVDPLTAKTHEVQLGSPRRLNTIYDVNMRTARAAGQEQRIQRNKITRPYKMYLLGPSENHREQHAAWADLVLPVDDPFWATHTPINGYGCKCHIRSLTKKKSERYGGVSKSPKIEYEDYENKRTGEVTRVPKGITPGFDINPGAVAQRDQAANVFGTKLKTASADIGAVAMENAAVFVQSGLTNNYRRWVQPFLEKGNIRLQKKSFAKGDVKVVAVMSGKIITQLRKRNIQPQTAAITLIDREAIHVKRDKKHAPLSNESILNLTEHLAAPNAVILDKKNNDLFYVFKVDGGYAKIVVDIGFNNTARLLDKRIKIKTNAITTSSMIYQKSNLEFEGLEILEGKL